MFSTITNPQNFPIAHRRDPSFAGVGSQSRGLGISSSGQLQQSFGTVIDIFVFPVLAFVAPSSKDDEANFTPLTREMLLQKALDLARAEVVEHPVLRGVDKGVWVDADGKLWVGEGKVHQVESGDCYVFLVRSDEEDFL
ncbi:hypothetical protein BDW69DRAFT_188677 [Aspergillus filifer]